MRLAISIAAWIAGDDAASRADEPAALSPMFRDLGFTALELPVARLPAALTDALAGVEPTDTLLLHIGGTLGKNGSIELSGSMTLELSLVADALAVKPCLRTLVFVEQIVTPVDERT